MEDVRETIAFTVLITGQFLAVIVVHAKRHATSFRRSSRLLGEVTQISHG
jgi:hypothetical protein